MYIIHVLWFTPGITFWKKNYVFVHCATYRCRQSDDISKDRNFIIKLSSSCDLDFFFHILNKSLYIILGNTVTLKCSDKMSSTYWSWQVFLFSIQCSLVLLKLTIKCGVNWYIWTTGRYMYTETPTLGACLRAIAGAEW